MTGPATETVGSQNAYRHGLSSSGDAELISKDLDGLLEDFGFPDEPKVLQGIVNLARADAYLKRVRGSWEAAAERLRNSVDNFETEEIRALGYSHTANICVGLRDWAQNSKPSDGEWRAQDYTIMDRIFRPQVRKKSRLHESLDELRKIERYARDGETRRRKILQEIHRSLAPTKTGPMSARA